jgi:hypothetical protein
MFEHVELQNWDSSPTWIASQIFETFAPKESVLAEGVAGVPRAHRIAQSGIHIRAGSRIGAHPISPSIKKVAAPHAPADLS